MCTKLELSRFQMATCLGLNLLHIQPFFVVLLSVLGGRSQSVTVRCSEHVRHAEDSKGHPAPFLPDCSLVSADYPFLTFANDLLLNQNETARAVSRYYFW
jgi:hypothetical protein